MAAIGLGGGVGVAGTTDLDEILRNLAVSRREGTWAVVDATDRPSLLAQAAAFVAEDEGPAVVVPTGVATMAGVDAGTPLAWLTIDVHTSLDGVGLTAALATALAADGIPCNVLAGFHHDHLLVPADRADDAVAAIQRLRR